MENNEISKYGFFDASYVADDRNEQGEQKRSALGIAVQVLFDQHLQVDLELSSGVLHKDKFVSPSTKSGFVWVSEEKIDVNTPLSGSALIATSAIVAIHFPKEREYVMTQRR